MRKQAAMDLKNLFKFLLNVPEYQKLGICFKLGFRIYFYAVKNFENDKKNRNECMNAR